MGETETKRAQQLYAEGAFAEAAQVLSDAIGEAETSTLWNDWGVVQFALREMLDAERAFRRALTLDPACSDAAANLAGLLIGVGHTQEAVPFLKRALETAVDPQRAILANLLTRCGEALPVTSHSE